MFARLFKKKTTPVQDGQPTRSTLDFGAEITPFSDIRALRDADQRHALVRAVNDRRRQHDLPGASFYPLILEDGWTNWMLPVVDHDHGGIPKARVTYDLIEAAGNLLTVRDLPWRYAAPLLTAVRTLAEAGTEVVTEIRRAAELAASRSPEDDDLRLSLDTLAVLVPSYRKVFSQLQTLAEETDALHRSYRTEQARVGAASAQVRYEMTLARVAERDLQAEIDQQRAMSRAWDEVATTA